jgi:predicted O-linked N-acetylglucosamine transferase (SPINDLY family)
MGESGREIERLGVTAMRKFWRRRGTSSHPSALEAQPSPSTTRDADELIAQGNRFEDAGDFQEALRCYKEALSATPNYARAYINIGNALRLLGRLDDAIASMTAAVRCAPNRASAHFNLGATLAASGNYAAAEGELRDAQRLEPSMAEAAVVLADMFESMGRLSEAESELQTALRIRPGYAGAALNLGLLYLRQDRLDRAESALNQAKTMKSAPPSVDAALGTLYLKTGRFSDADHALRSALERDPTLQGARSTFLFLCTLGSERDARTIFDEHARSGAEIAKIAGTPYENWGNRPEPDRKLRIGYVSADLGQHPIGLFLRPVLERHDRAHFDVYCYSDRERADDVTQTLERTVEHWREVAGIRDQLVADQIRRDQIDILVDLSGHTAGNRLSLFARRPAPIQVTWLGYLNTTGLPTMDYRICDRHTDPADSDQFHTEKLYRMPHSQWCYSPVHDVAPVQTPHVRTPEALVFGSFNQYMKISDPCLALWRRILAQVPDATLAVWDVPPGRTQDLFRRRLAEQQIDPDRVVIHGRTSILEYFAAIADVDIALDTFPYNGATTTLDTLWMGVPLVALCGERGVARSGYSILRSMGLPELIASSPDEYVALNVRLARDVGWRVALRSTLRSRLTASPVMDAVAFVADLEVAYAEMWRGWCSRRRRDV